MDHSFDESANHACLGDLGRIHEAIGEKSEAFLEKRKPAGDKPDKNEREQHAAHSLHRVRVNHKDDKNGHYDQDYCQNAGPAAGNSHANEKTCSRSQEEPTSVNSFVQDSVNQESHCYAQIKNWS